MQNNAFFFPHTLYLRHLTVINGIHFSRREIDVVACLLHTRGTSKIAALLNIAPTTVITHIQNVMEKLKCNSREEIIDFMERSHNLVIIKRYYASLVVHGTFEKSLKASSKLINTPLSSLIVYCKGQERRNILENHLQAHLKLAGIEADVRPQQFRYNREDIENQKRTLIVILEKEGYRDISQKLKEFASVDLSSQENYYLSVFEILKKLCPKVDFDQVILEFKKTYETLQELNKASSLPPLNNNLSLNPKDLPSIKDRYPEEKHKKKRGERVFSLRKKLLFLVSALFLIGVMGISFLTFYEIHQDKKDRIISPIQQLEHSPIHSDEAFLKESAFLQRPELLAEIDKTFKAGSSIQIVALVGPGGAGKTVLARQYAYQQHADVIWEINAETNESLKLSYENLAETLAKKEEDKKTLRAIKEIEKPGERENKIIQFVKEKLKTYSNWVLIFDNLETSTAIKKYLPQNPETWGFGKVLITTRNDNIRHSIYVDHIVPIGPLSSIQKHDLFCKIIKKGEKTVFTAAQDEKIKEFLKEIPPFPLDVSVAAHYIKSTGTSYSQYLESSFQNRKTFVTLQENLLKEAGDYINTRYRIIALSLEQIMNTSKDARDLLLLISLIDSQNIPRDLLTKAKSNEVVDSFIYHLKKYSLLLSQPFALPSQNSTLSFHRSTHAMLLSYLKESLNFDKNTKLISSISNTLEQYTKDAIETEGLLQMSNMKPHLRAFLSHEDLLNTHNKGAIEAELGCAYYYTHYQETAKQLLESSIAKLSLYPCKENYSRIAQALSYLGNMHKEVGAHKKARDLLEKSILLYRQHDSQNYIGMTRALAYLGDTYKNLGDHQKARDLLEKSIALSQKHADSNQLGVARTMLYLGIVYRDLGDYEKSVPLLKNSLILFKKHENYIELARALKYLANTYRSLGRYEEAIPLLEESVIICKKYLPENHIALGRSLVHLATLYKNLGEYKKAQDLLIESLQIHQKVFGSHSVRTAWVVTQLANIDRELGEHEKALESIKGCLKVYLKSYGENSLRTSWVFMQLGYVYEDLKNYRQAETILETALKIHRHHFEENHIKVAVILFHLGNVYKGLGQYKKANDFLEKSLKIYEKHYGKDHIETAKILGSLGHLYLCKGNLDEAETIMNKALNILKRKQHPYQFLIYESLAELHLQHAQIKSNKGNPVEAETLKAQAIVELKHALVITQALFPENSAHTKRMRKTLNMLMLN